MDQKTFLAIVLSLGIFVVYNKVVVEPKIKELKIKNSQVIVNKQDTETSQSLPSAQPAIQPQAVKQQPKNIVDEKVYQISNEEMTLDISTLGANLKKITLKKYNHTLPVTSFANLPDFQNNIFELKKLDTNYVEFLLKNSNFEITKVFQLKSGFEVEVIVRIHNKLAVAQDFSTKFNPMVLDMSSVDKNISQTDKVYFEYSILTDTKMHRKGHAENFSEKESKTFEENVKWVGFRDRFFATIVRNQSKVENFKYSPDSKEKMSFEYSISGKIPPNESIEKITDIYYGPQQLEPMKEYHKEYDRILAFSNFKIIDFFAFSIYKAVHFIQKYVKNWGVSIILVSFALFALTYPLTLKSMSAMKKLQAIQPQINAIKEKHKNNPEKINVEMAELIRKSGANPFGGCLPMLLQMPIFFAVFQVFWRTFSFRGQSFLWIKDLSLPDRLIKFPVELPIIGGYLNILPIMYAGTIFLQQKFSSKNVVYATEEDAMRQKMMANMMPIVLVFAFYNFSSSITLYFTVFYSLQTLAQWKLSQAKKTT